LNKEQKKKGLIYTNRACFVPGVRRGKMKPRKLTNYWANSILFHWKHVHIHGLDDNFSLLCNTEKIYS